MGETDAVRAVIEKWAAGVRAARNIDAALKGHGADLLMFDVVGPVALRELEEDRRSWSEQFFRATEDGKRVAFTLRLTVGLEKRDGEWTIVHEHHSQPLDFDRPGSASWS